MLTDFGKQVVWYWVLTTSLQTLVKLKGIYIYICPCAYVLYVNCRKVVCIIAVHQLRGASAHLVKKIKMHKRPKGMLILSRQNSTTMYECVFCVCVCVCVCVF